MLGSVGGLLFDRMQVPVEFHTAAKVILASVHLPGFMIIRDHTALLQWYYGPARPYVGPALSPVLHQIINLVRMLFPQFLNGTLQTLDLLFPRLHSFPHTEDLFFFYRYPGFELVNLLDVPQGLFFKLLDLKFECLLSPWILLSFYFKLLLILLFGFIQHTVMQPHSVLILPLFPHQFSLNPLNS